MATSAQFINRIIIKLFESWNFNDVKTLVCRVLYEVVMSEDHIPCAHMMDWARRTYVAYFTKEDIPNLHAHIYYMTYKVPGHWRHHFEDVIIKSSNEYLNQKRMGNLNNLSRTLISWQKESNIYSAEDLHLMYMTDYFRDIESSNYDDPSNDEIIPELAGAQFEFMVKYQRYLCAFAADRWGLGRAVHCSCCRPHEYSNRHSPQTFWNNIHCVLNEPMFALFCQDIGDESVMRRIGALCKLSMKVLLNMEHIEWDRNILLIRAYCNVATYYFWHRFKYRTSINYLHRAILLAKNCRNLGYLTMANDHLLGFNLIVGNYQAVPQCVDFIDERSKYYSLKKWLMQKVMSNDRTFDASDTKAHRKLIKEAFSDRFEPSDRLKALAYKITRLLQVDANCYAVRNLLRRRQCHYEECGRKDVKSLKACARCQRVFYCCRRHQKLHWRKTHRHRCSEID